MLSEQIYHGNISFWIKIQIKAVDSQAGNDHSEFGALKSAFEHLVLLSQALPDPNFFYA